MMGSGRSQDLGHHVLDPRRQRTASRSGFLMRAAASM
jgi:hypothetical protein